ncbi:MAG: hypothetical protein VYD57_00610 [Pseudomonadota bacterium]|nr:hypothetical protein [Pseudomonadota bacterium]
MPNLLVSDIDETTLRRLDATARRNGRSLQDEIRHILLAHSGHSPVGAPSMKEEASSASLWHDAASRIEEGIGIRNPESELGAPALAGHSLRSPEDQASLFAFLRSLGRKPDEPFDIKAVSDEFWTFVD